jgi:hypothetical protein
MAQVIDINALPAGMTRREVAVMAGLAKANTRGRMSGEANRLLDKLEADGYVFSTPAATGDKVDKAKALVSQTELDLYEFREWCVREGIKPPEKRIPTELLNRYVTEVPDFKRREAVVKPARNEAGEKVEIKPLPNYDAKAARKWAIDQKLEGIPERGRLPRWIAERFIAAHAEAGTEVPKAEPEANNFGPTPERIRRENWYEGVDSHGVKVRKSWRDADAVTGYSIAYVAGDVYAWSPSDTDEKVLLQPVG